MMTRLSAAFALLLSLAALIAPASAQQGQNPSFNLVNRSQQVINELYASPAGMTTWGRDKLGNDTIAVGGSFAVRLPADGNCIYDIRVVYADGSADERRAVNTCNVDNVTFTGSSASARPASNDPSFRVVNRGRSEITEVYATPAGQNTWGRDRLGDDTIAVGANHLIRLPTGECVYDVKVVFGDGTNREKRRINLCNVTDLPFP